ncbi:MAG: hypothetical protein K2Y21_01150 [Phycisphaerales bacterium]|nr:hypothetical protein [Phycisphaerales bacterium]
MTETQHKPAAVSTLIACIVIAAPCVLAAYRAWNALEGSVARASPGGAPSIALEIAEHWLTRVAVPELIAIAVIVCVAALAAAVWTVRLVRSPEVRPDLCGMCGYPRPGADGPCPECGAGPTEARRRADRLLRGVRHAFVSCVLGAVAFVVIGFVPLRHEVAIARGMFVSMQISGVSGVSQTMSAVQFRGVAPVSAFRMDPDASRVESRFVELTIVNPFTRERARGRFWFDEQGVVRSGQENAMERLGVAAGFTAESGLPRMKQVIAANLQHFYPAEKLDRVGGPYVPTTGTQLFYIVIAALVLVPLGRGVQIVCRRE